uniref:Uncharacterized protein n=1 Tax=Glossina morsitans morsitans TaxID=37546 RepID=A0A1B0FEK3_GLOMM
MGVRTSTARRLKVHSIRRVDNSIKGSQGIVTLDEWASSAIGRGTVKFMWQWNYATTAVVPSVSRRLGASMYRNEYLRGGTVPEFTQRGYAVEVRNGSANLDMFVQSSKGVDDPVVERIVSRLDAWREAGWGYKLWPGDGHKRGGGAMLGLPNTAILMEEAGWTGFSCDTNPSPWGRGISQRVRRFAQNEYATLVLGLSSALSGSEFGNHAEEGFPRPASSGDGGGTSGAVDRSGGTDPQKSAMPVGLISEEKLESSKEKAVVKDQPPSIVESIFANLFKHCSNLQI